MSVERLPLAESALGFTLRDWQSELAAEVLKGRDLLAVLPTGAGKSVIFQAPALSGKLPGAALVISPTIALIQDQTAKLRAKGLPVAALHKGSKTQSEKDLRSAKMIYTTPEALRSPRVQSALASRRLEYAAVDEAHCVSLWGHHFRPAYLTLAAALDGIGKRAGHRIPRLALTATANADVRRDIIALLGQNEPAVHADGDRVPGNLSLRVCRDPAEREALVRQALKARHSSIVFCATRRSTEALSRRHRPSAAYHAGMPVEDRMAAWEAFAEGRVPVLFATSALSMGVDLHAVSEIIHYHPPIRSEAYRQEAGRCGRAEGSHGTATLCAVPEDLNQQSRMAKGNQVHVTLALAILERLREAPGEAFDPVAYGQSLQKGLTPAQLLTTSLCLVSQGLALAESGGQTAAIRLRALPGKEQLDVAALERRNQAAERAYQGMVAYAKTASGTCLMSALQGDAPPCGICSHCLAKRDPGALRHADAVASALANPKADCDLPEDLCVESDGRIVPTPEAMALLRSHQWAQGAPLAPLEAPGLKPEPGKRVGDPGVNRRVLARMKALNRERTFAGKPAFLPETLIAIATAPPEDGQALAALIPAGSPDREALLADADEVLDALAFHLPDAETSPSP